MLDLGKLREREKALLQKMAKARSDYDRHQARVKKATREDDTHRKVVLGAIVLAAVRAGDLETDYFGRLIEKHATERDRKAFDGGPFAVWENANPERADSDLGEQENGQSD